MHECTRVFFRLGELEQNISVELTFDFVPDKEQLVMCLKHYLLDQEFDINVSRCFLAAAENLPKMPAFEIVVGVKTGLSNLGWADTFNPSLVRVYWMRDLLFKEQKDDNLQETAGLFQKQFT